MIYEDRIPTDIEKKTRELVGKTFDPSGIDSSLIQTFAYQYPKRPITVEYKTSEFTCVCPYSGLPDCAYLSISYVPQKRCIELKSLKYYLYAYRQTKIFNEHVVNKILQDLTLVVKPRQMTIRAEFTSRGGITSTVTANYRRTEKRRN